MELLNTQGESSERRKNLKNPKQGKKVRFPGVGLVVFRTVGGKIWLLVFYSRRNRRIHILGCRHTHKKKYTLVV